MNAPSPLDRARDLAARGLAPIPVPQGTKRPTIPGWQNLRLTDADLPRYFDGTPCNIGTLLGEPAGWIVDVDLDHPRAVELADTFLPHTGMTWGRESKPRSHRLYRVTGPVSTKKWTSKAAGMLVELRSTGCQTIAPGSTHPSGEAVRWDDDGAPAEIDPAELSAWLAALADAVRSELGEGPEADGVPVPQPPSRPWEPSKYALEAVRQEAATVSGTPKGSRSDALNRAAFKLGTLVGSGELDRGTVEQALHQASIANGHVADDGEAAIRSTIQSGLDSGVEHPRSVPQKDVTGTGTPGISRGNRGSRDGDTRLRLPSAFKPFPVHVLPQPVARFITECSAAIGCDAAYIALPLLSGLAAAIGNTCVIALKKSWREPAIVWTALVGESGTAKSPAIELALRPIRKRQHEAMKEHALAMEQYAQDLARHDRDVVLWKRNKHADDSPSKPEMPIANRCWTDDATTEAIAVLLQQNPRGLLMVRDELAGWFNFDRYSGGKGGGDVAKWLEMFGGRAMLVDRKSGVPLYIPRAAVSIAGGIQPATLQRSMGREHRENGLAARLLFAMPPRKPKRWTEADVAPQLEDEIEEIFESLFGLAMLTSQNDDEEPRVFGLSEDGKRAWVAFYGRHADKQVHLVGEEAAAWAKLEGYTARLALIVHLVRCAAKDPSLRDRRYVDAQSVATGVALVEWFGCEARRVYATLGESEQDGECRQLVEWIGRQGGAATVNELAHSLRSYRGDPESAERDLQRLVTAGVGVWEMAEPGPRGGRPTRRFRLLPPDSVTETPSEPEVVEGLGSSDNRDATPESTDVSGEGEAEWTA